MGAEQSAPHAQAVTAPGKTCYYEVLGVDRQAGDDEIRRAYKRKALELHPDRNLDDTATATRRFAEVQTAYEILSDAQERAWYDSHRDAILGGYDDADDVADSQQPSAVPSSHRPGGRLTSPEHIFALMGRFSSAIPLTDAADGFFGILNDTFDQLRREEVEACAWAGLEPALLPAFGRAGDGYDSVVRPFYSAWSGFATKKSFSWKDKYRLADAPDRRVRRLMEKENRKLRDEAARDLNDAVKSLVAFVKKRDPRYVPSSQSEAERQQVLRDSAAAQAARSRAVNQQKLADFVVPEWAQQGHGDQRVSDFSASEDDEQSEVEQIECVVCNKVFKSEKQFEAHERSKKHVKAVQQMRRQMERDDADLRLNPPGPPSTSATNNTMGSPSPEQEQQDVSEGGGASRRPDSSAPSPANPDDHGAARAPDGASESKAGQAGLGARESSPRGSDRTESAHDDGGDHAPREAVASRVSAGHAPEHGSDADAERQAPSKAGTQASEAGPGRKVGKARAKREKRAAKQAASEAPDHEAECLLCHSLFSSRNELFSHIRDTGHVGPASAAPRAKSGGKRPGGGRR